MDVVNDLKKYVETHKEIEEVFSFEEYLAKVKETPNLACNAHKRIYDMICSYGIDVDPETSEEKYKFFETELFGIEDSTRQIMEYFKGAALGSDVSRRFLLLYGPPSSGKSNLVTMLKDAMEAWTKTDKGAVYAIKGCPMNEEPMHLIPGTMRSQVAKDLKIAIEGELCPVCAHKLKNEFKGDFNKFQVHRIYFSQQSRIGVGTFVPGDIKSQDQSELIGSVDLSKIGQYGVESDPRAYRFDGELNIANRGVMEFIEILKADPKFLYILLTATQERNIKTPRFPLLSCDEVILSHTNESEYKKFVGQPENEALIDRMIVCRVRYNLKVNEEVRIYQKLLSHGDTGEIHIAPHTLKVASMFSILSRLEEPKDQNINKVKKMKLYNEEDVEGLTKQDVSRLKKETPLEGMDGISPRYITNRLVATAIKKADTGTKRYITPIDVLKALKEGMDTTSKFAGEEKARYEELFGLVKTEFDHIARTEVQKAFFVSFESEAQSLLNNYIDNVEAYLNETKLKDPLTDQDIEPDEKLMRSIEGKIGVSDESKSSFRNEVIRKVGSALRRNQKFRYEDHARLREAIEKQLFEERRDVIKMTITARTKDPDELKRINQVVQTLCDRHGYIPESANDLLRYVSSMMAREK